MENNDAISASCAVFTPLTKGLSPKHREGRIERSLSKLCFHHDRLDRTFVNRTVYRDTHYSNRCLSHIPPMLAFPSIPIFQSSNSPRVRKKERKEKKNFRENSRSTLVDHLDCFDLSLQREGGASRWWLCHRVRFKPGFEGVLGRFHELTNALRHARSASWSSGGTLFSRERRKKGKKRGRIVLHVTQIGTVDRNGDCSMKRNGALRQPRDCFASNGYSMMVYQ